MDAGTLMAACGATAAVGALILQVVRHPRERQSAIVSDMDKLNSGYDRMIARLTEDLRTCREDRQRLEARERALVAALRLAGVDEP